MQELYYFTTDFNFNKVKKLIVLYTLFGLFTGTFANPVDDSTAKLVGRNFLLYKTNFSQHTNIDNLSLSYTAIDSISQKALFYVFNTIGTKGFVIVAADNSVKPILGYSDEINFDNTNIPIQFTEWMDGYKSEINYAVKNSKEIDTSWKELLKPRAKPTKELFGLSTFGIAVVSPLLKTTWNQSPYYNTQCPIDATKGQTVTGCVATVMAQIMKYWKYPAKGIGTRSYIPKSNPQFGLLTANFGGTTYLWDSMPNALLATSTANQTKAIATLMYQCGVSVNMDYTTTNSVAYTTGGLYYNSADYALQAYFGYDNNLQAIQRSSFTSAKWIDTIEKELKAGRPVIYRGTGSGGGHSFIADGYDNNNYLHINWGWGGSNNGYYQMDSLNPKSIGIGGGAGGYNNTQFAIIGIQPNAGTLYGIGLNSTLTLSSATIPFDSVFSVTANLINVGTTNFAGDYSAAVFDASNNFVDFIQTISNTTLKSGISTKSLKFSTLGLTTMLPGTYEVAIYYRTTGGNWTLVANNGIFNNYIFIKVNPVVPKIITLALSGCKSIVYNGKTYLSSTVVNDTLKAVQGWDSLYKVATITITAPVTPSVSIAATKTTINKGDNVLFTATPTNGGTTPTYQWKKNSVNINGATAATYTTTTLSNNDTITCQLTSNVACVTFATTLSNKIIEKVITSLSISGNLITPSGTGIPKVFVGLNGAKSLFTNKYSFTVSSNANYTLKPSKNNDSFKTNGVSIIDVYLVQAHILGKQLLGSPYKIIAADVNNDGSVSLTDVFYMKRLILGLDTTFTGTRLWAFVDSAYKFPIATNPFPYKDSISFNNLLSNQPKQTFIGVKLGDVNYDWKSTIAGIDNKPNKPIQLYYPTISTIKGNQTEVRIPLKVKDFKNIIGFQFTLNYNSKNLQLVGVENNTLGIEYNTTHKENGRITFLWNDKTILSRTLMDSTKLMDLLFTQKENGGNDSLSITDDITPIEAWDANYQKHGMELSAINDLPITQPILSTENWAIVPNPSDGLLKINLSLKENKDIHFYLTTVEGRLLSLKKIAVIKGFSTLTLNLNEHGKLAAGVYYLKALGLDVQDTKKVIIR